MSRHSDSDSDSPPRLRRLLLATSLLGALAIATTWIGRIDGAPEAQYLIFDRLFYFDDHVGAIAMLVALGLALACRGPVERGLAAFAAACAARPVQLAACAFVALAIGARLVYMGHPLAMDEYAPLLQAHAFARGEIAARVPPGWLDREIPDAVKGTFLLVNPATGQVASAYWPGLALLMTPFVWLHAAWCLNPALSAVALLLIGDLAVRVAGTPQARGWAMLAALASPAFTVNAMSFYAMPTLLALNLLFLWLILRPGWRSALMAGAVGSVALVLHNPLPHALFAAPCLVWLAWDRARWPRLCAVFAGYLPGALVLGLGWPVLMASQGLSPTSPEGAPAQGGILAGLALARHVFRWPTHGLLAARVMATWKIWIWACPGLPLALLLARPRERVAALLLAALLLTYASYFLVIFDQGHGWGYRYVHPAWGIFPVVAAAWVAKAGAPAQRAVAVAICAGLLASPVFFWLVHARIEQSMALRIEPPGEGRWVVFVAQPDGHYAADVVQNLPGDERVLTLVSRGPARDRAWMAAHFPQTREVVSDERGSSWRLSDESLAPVR